MAHLSRFQDWQTRLAYALAEIAQQEIEYGKIDCGLFAADIIMAMTGTDVAHDLRGKYKTERGAYAFLKRKFGGYAESVTAVAERSGMPEVTVLMAQRGDLLLVGSVDRCAAGIVDMTGHRAAIYPKRLAFVPIAHAQRAWRV